MRLQDQFREHDADLHRDRDSEKCTKIVPFSMIEWSQLALGDGLCFFEQTIRKHTVEWC